MTQKTPPRSPDALDFSPGLLSIQENPPGRLPKAIMYSVSALFVILLLWAIFGKLDTIASAQGHLVPRTYVKIVQPADAGIVHAILVKEGEAVKAGQVLIRMDPKDTKADEKMLQTELTLKSLQLRRIAAELNGRPLRRRASDPEAMFRQINAQYKDHRQAYINALAQARDALDKARQESDSGKEVLIKLREITPILAQQAAAYADMGKGGYAPKLMVRNKQREYLEKLQDLRAQKSTVASLTAAVAEARKRLAQVSAKYHSNLQNEWFDAEGQYQKLKQAWIKQKHKVRLLELRAPQAGVVKDISTHTIGTVVSPGTVLLTLVPENEPLLAEVMVKNDAIGFIFPRQKVKVKITAYPFEKYGMLDGTVIYIGPDASGRAGRQSAAKDSSKSSPPPGSPYKVLIALQNQVLEAQGKKFKLVPGMQVIAEINEGRRTVMEYLLSPVEKTLDDSGHER